MIEILGISIEIPGFSFEILGISKICDNRIPYVTADEKEPYHESRCLLARTCLSRQASVSVSTFAAAVILKNNFTLFCNNLDGQKFHLFYDKIQELRGTVIYGPHGKTE